MKRQTIECLYVLIGILIYCSILGWMDARDQRLEKNKLAVENAKLKLTKQECMAELNNGLNPTEVHTYRATCYLHGAQFVAKGS